MPQVTLSPRSDTVLAEPKPPSTLEEMQEVIMLLHHVGMNRDLNPVERSKICLRAVELLSRWHSLSMKRGHL